MDKTIRIPLLLKESQVFSKIRFIKKKSHLFRKIEHRYFFLGKDWNNLEIFKSLNC